MHHQPVVPGPGFQGQWPLSASAAAVICTSAGTKAGSNWAWLKPARFFLLFYVFHPSVTLEEPGLWEVSQPVPG